MLQVQVLSLVTKLAGRGVKLDSVRRSLNRAGVSTMGLGLPSMFARAVRVTDNAARLLGAHRNTIPRAGRDMVPESFKIPANYRYVVEVAYKDPTTGEVFTQARSVYSLDALSLAEAERLGMRSATLGLRSPRGRSDPFAPFQVDSAIVLNAYYNESQ